jgi:DNA helicase II / ATP-dependent DNA helicase PcrA
MIDYKKELNDEQYKVITDGDGPCLVLAGAGSGKTRTLVYRLLYLLEQGVDPGRILLVTFTNRAASEMMNRVEVLYGQKPRGLWGGTFHGVGNRILRKYGRHIGIESNFTILDSEDSQTLIKSCLKSVSVPQDKYFPKAKLVSKIISLSANLAKPINTVIYDRFPQIDREHVAYIERISEVYQEKKKKANALDYDDLLSQWNRLLIESKTTRDALAKKFTYILVDEYQDTNHIQGEVINHLAGSDQNVLVVGDDSQSIYSFRGADVNNILTFPKVYKNSKTFKLETNYRSTPEILKLANLSIEHNENKFEKKLKTNKKSSLKPALASLDDNRDQANFICKRIIELEESGIEAKDMAILFRAHYQSLEIEMELNKQTIPYTLRGGLRFFEQAHIKDVVAYLKIVHNLHDELAWLRILQMQPGIGGANAEKIYQMVSIFQTLPEILNSGLDSSLGARVSAGWRGIVPILARLASADSDDVANLVRLLIDSSYQDYLRGTFENYKDRLDDLEQLEVFARDYKTLDKILADIALAEGFKGADVTSEKPREGVVLSTIHQAKGLEWKVVFVVGLVDGQFPGAQVFDRPQDVEEERRLFYVATTRAEDQLFLTYPIYNSRSGNTNTISQFIRELPEDVYDDWHIQKYASDDDEVRYVDEDEDSISDQFWQRIKKHNK